MTVLSPHASEETKFNGKIGQLKASKPLIQELIPGLKKKSANEWEGPCPSCGGTNRFIVFTDKQTYWCRQCNAKGDILSYITLTTGKTIKEQLAEAGLLASKRRPLNSKQNLPAHIWSQSKSGAEAAATIRKAFAFRSIQLEQIPPVIRLNSYNGQLSIACAMQSPLDEKPPAKPQCVHLTLLDEEGKKKKRSETSPSTKYQGSKTGLVVMLPGKDSSSLVIGEGLETTLSAMQAMGFSGMVCGDAGNMAGMAKLREQFQQIFILADSDKSLTGQRDALKAAESIGKANPKAAVWLVAPDDSCFTDSPKELDFNDLLMQDTSGGSIKARFERKQRLDEIDIDWRPKAKEQPGETAEPEDERWFLVEQGEKGKLKLAAPSRAAQVVSKMIAGKFAVDADTKHWHQYTGEQWKECKGEFKETLVSILEKGTGVVGCNASYKRDIEEFIVDSGRNKIKAEPENKVPFLNGIFDLKTKEMKETTPDNALQWCLPYKYDKTADCKFFKGWLDHVCDDETGGLQKMIRAVINVCLMERPDLQYFVHLVGKPGSGKGTLSRLLQKIVGSEGFTTSDIELLQKDKFESSSYYQKRMVIFDEVPGHVPIKKFLQLTGRDPMRYEQKYGKIAPTFIFGGLVLMLGNSLFSTDDQTNFAPERRRLTVRFDKVFTADEKAVWNVKGGEETLLHKEIPGIINWALGMSRDEVSEVFHNPPVKVVQANQEAEAVSLPIVEFVKDHIEYDPTGFVYIGVSREQFVEGVSYFQDEGTKLYPRYLCWCKGTGRRPLQRGKFLDALIEAANRRLLPSPESEPVEKGATKLEGGYPVKKIRLVPWTETEFGS
jgi:putative DNA primase/helicase